MFWKKKKACSRCGAALPKSDGEASSGERLCAQCALTAFGAMLPDEGGPEIDAFLKRTLNLISIKSDTDPTLFAASCKTMLGSDVEIQKMARGYQITFYAGLLDDRDRTTAVVDYVVDWIRANPLNVKPLTVKRIGAQTLPPNGMFVFLFIPASRPLPSDEDIQFMEAQFAPAHLRGKLGWQVCSQPYDDGPSNNSFIRETLDVWSSQQSDPTSIMMKPVPVETRAGRKLNCLLIYRDSPTR